MYIGRFAPSPSGPLHFGSLVCALASYLDAKKNNGQWLVRIEDIDPPREQLGASEHILHTLKTHGLLWDQPVVYQSKHSEAYLNVLCKLDQLELTYPCNCTRQRLKSLSVGYDQHCLHTPPPANQPAAIRINTSKALTLCPKIAEKNASVIQFHDLIQGEISENMLTTGDFIVHRKDGLFAYQIAVSSDDIAQNITHIVRGNDLLATTPQQILLHHLLNSSAPNYGHIPVVVDYNNIKLSKQNHAPAINNDTPLTNLLLALKALHLKTPENRNTIQSLLRWAVENWSLTPFQQQQTINISDLT